jgi:hypothetical protein
MFTIDHKVRMHDTDMAKLLFFGSQFRLMSDAFEDFIAEYPAETTHNHSLIFGRRGNSWHGVRRINCPPDHYRKVFIVVFEEYQPLKMAFKKFKRLLRGKPLTTDKESLMY